MMKTIVIANQKGGVGKSTTTHTFGYGLIQKGFRVLFLDLDPQGNLSYTLQSNPDVPTLYELLLNPQTSIFDFIQTKNKSSFIASSPLLSSADMIFYQTGKEYLLKETLSQPKLQEMFDFVLIDTPPSLGILTVNALTAGNSLIIPAQADIYSLQGIGQLYQTITTVQKYCNPSLSILGILLTRFHARSILSKDLSELIADTAKQFDTEVFQTTIREGIAIKEAQANQEDLFSYSPKNNVTLDYLNFTEECLELLQGGRQHE